jgi:hypothetical protein
MLLSVVQIYTFSVTIVYEDGSAVLGFYSDVTRVNRPEVIVTGGLKVAPVMHSAYTWMSLTENRSEVVVTAEI